MKGMSSYLAGILAVGLILFVSEDGLAQLSQRTTGCIRGWVTSAQQGSMPSSNTRLTLHGNGYMASSNVMANNRFEFCQVPSGDYVLEATSIGHENTRLELPHWSPIDGEGVVNIVLRPVKADHPTPPANNQTISLNSLKAPQEAKIRMIKAITITQKGEWEKSRKELKKLVDDYPDYADAWINLGVVNVQLKQWKDAESAFLKSISLDGGSFVAFRKLGQLYLDNGLPEKAQVALNRAVQQNARDAKSHAYLGCAYYQLERWTDSEQALLRALELQPSLPLALYELGFLRIKQQRYQEAKAVWDSYLRFDPPNSSASQEIKKALAQMEM